MTIQYHKVAFDYGYVHDPISGVDDAFGDPVAEGGVVGQGYQFVEDGVQTGLWSLNGDDLLTGKTRITTQYGVVFLELDVAKPAWAP